MKIYTLTLLNGLMVLLTSYSLGEVANKDKDNIIGWVAEYEDNGKAAEGTANGASDPDPKGTSALWDIIMHIITAFYGVFVLTGITVGSMVFYTQFIEFPFDDGFTCDLELDKYSISNYSGISFAGITDRETCKKNMPANFAVLDDNKDGVIERCEDARFIYIFSNAAGVPVTKEWAFKYSENYSKAYFVEFVCNESFRDMPPQPEGTA